MKLQIETTVQFEGGRRINGTRHVEYRNETRREFDVPPVEDGKLPVLTPMPVTPPAAVGVLIEAQDPCTLFVAVQDGDPACAIELFAGSNIALQADAPVWAAILHHGATVETENRGGTGLAVTVFEQ